MEYDDNVSARLDMSLDEIIVQEQQDGPGQGKKRRGRGGPPGPATPPGPTNASPSRPPHLMPTAESTSRYASFPPPVGAPTFHTRGPTSGRPMPPFLQGGPPGRVPGPPPFGAGPRLPFHMGPGHPGMSPRWPRPRGPPGGSYLMAPTGMQPPPPPLGAGPLLRGPLRAFPMAHHPGGSGEVSYSPRRPLPGPYSVQRPRLQQGPPGPAAWRRGRYSEEDQNGERPPLSFSGPALRVGGPCHHVVGEPNGSLPYGYGPQGPQSVLNNRPVEYYDSAYPRDARMDGGHIYGVSMGEGGHADLLQHPGSRGPQGLHESGRNRSSPQDFGMGATEFNMGASGVHPARGADSAVGSALRYGSQGEPREFTVIISNVPKDLPAVEIQEAFGCIGTVLRTDVMLNSKGEHTGRVCIAFATAEAAKAAVAQFDEGDLNGNTIRVFAE